MLTSNTRNAQNIWMNVDKTEETDDNQSSRRKSPSICSIDSETRIRRAGGGFSRYNQVTPGRKSNNSNYTSNNGGGGRGGRQSRQFGGATSPSNYFGNGNGGGFNSSNGGNSPMYKRSSFYNQNEYRSSSSSTSPFNHHQNSNNNMYNHSNSNFATSSRNYPPSHQNQQRRFHHPIHRSPSPPQILNSARIRRDSSDRESGGGRSSVGSHIHRYRAAGTAPSPSASIISSPYKESALKMSSETSTPSQQQQIQPQQQAPQHYQPMMNMKSIPEKELHRFLSINPQLQYNLRLLPIATSSEHAQSAPIPVPQHPSHHPQQHQNNRHFFPSYGSIGTPEMMMGEVSENENPNENGDQNVNFCSRLRDAYKGINPNVKNQLHEHQQQNPHVQNQHQMTHEEVLFSIQNLQMQGAQVMHPGMMPYYTGHPYSKYSGSEETSSNGSTPFKGARQDQQNHVAPPPPTPSSQNNAQNHLEINDESGRKLDIKPLMEEYEQPNKVGYQNRGTTSRNSENSDNGRSTRGKAKIIERRPSNASDIDSISTSSSISSAQDLTITKSTRNGIKPPPPPTSVLTKDGGYEVSHMDVLSEKIWHYHNKVSQTDEMLSRKLQLRDMLYSSISPVFPMCGLYVVGSSLNGFGNNSSDMDLCLMITNKELDQKNDAVVVLNLILATLQYEKFVTSQKLILAKVPILRIKFAEPFGDITVDLNANNSVAIRNTHLLCYYSAYDWRVRPLVSVVKEWAKRKGINDANKSTFTSYSLVLMVIHYLQCGTNPVVLPNLQKLYPNRFSNKIDVRTLNVTMTLENVGTGSGGNSTTSTTTSATASNSNGNSSPMEIPAVAEDNTTLGELLIGFLDYYANQFDYDRDAISIRQGQRLERSVVARPKNMTAPPPPSQLSMNGAGICGTAVPNQQQQQTSTTTPPPSTSASTSSIQSCSKQQQVQTQAQQNQQQLFQGAWRSQWRCVCIEEPFTNSNTAHSIYDEMVFGAIKDAFREAHGELRKNHDLDRLMQCEPINVTIPATGAVVYAALYEGERPAYYGQPYQPHIQQQQQRRQPNGAQNNTYNRNGGRRYSSNQNQKSSRSQENVIVANGVEKKEDCKVRSDLTTPSPIPPASSSATSSTSVSSSNSPASTSAPNSSSSTSSNNVVVVSANK